jgi:hypothetical protein
MGQKYVLINLGTGLINGGFLDSDYNQIVAPPANAVAITDAQWQAWIMNPPGFQWNGAAVVAVVPAPATPTGASTQFGGCTVHSTATPAMNANYPCDYFTLQVLQGQAAYATAKAALPGGLATLSVAQIGGTVYAFATVTLFVNFVNALTNFVSQCAQYDLLAGVGIALPGIQTIA